MAAMQQRQKASNRNVRLALILGAVAAALFVLTLWHGV
jgi:hypothetical protein